MSKPAPKLQALPPTGWVRQHVLLSLGVLPFTRTKMREEINAGRFPAPRKFSARVVAYDAQAVHRWIEQQREVA